MILDARETAKTLTPSQRQCILDLSTEWQSTGYDKTIADILYAIGDTDLFGCFGALVECDWVHKPGVYPHYQHRLTKLGSEVQHHVSQLCLEDEMA